MFPSIIDFDLTCECQGTRLRKIMQKTKAETRVCLSLVLSLALSRFQRPEHKRKTRRLPVFQAPRPAAAGRGVARVMMERAGDCGLSLSCWPGDCLTRWLGDCCHSGQPRASAENRKTNREPQPDVQIIVRLTKHCALVSEAIEGGGWDFIQ